MAQFAENHNISIMQPVAAQLGNKDEDNEKTNEIEEMQPLVARIHKHQ